MFLDIRDQLIDKKNYVEICQQFYFLFNNFKIHPYLIIYLHFSRIIHISILTNFKGFINTLFPFSANFEINCLTFSKCFKFYVKCFSKLSIFESFFL